MAEQFSRSVMLIGQAGQERLSRCRVAVFGIGGVGSYAAEALVRSGIGALDFVDGDTLTESNLNRQLIALHSTLGQNKAEAMRDRALDINPAAQITAWPLYYSADRKAEFDLSLYDYVLDCVDTVSAKLLLVQRAQALGVPMISAMGAGNKLDPLQLRIADISQSSVCPLARVMRKELAKRAIRHLTVAYSLEPPHKPALPEKPVLSERLIPPGKTSQVQTEDPPAPRRATPGSLAFVPGAMGLNMAAYVVRELLQQH